MASTISEGQVIQAELAESFAREADTQARELRADSVELRHLDVQIYKKLAQMAGRSDTKVTIQNGTQACNEDGSQSHRYNVYLQRNSTPSDFIDKLDGALLWQKKYTQNRQKSAISWRG